MRLQNKVAIITGGGTGIGREIAYQFSHEGAYVAICGRRKQLLETTVKIIKETGGEALFCVTDVTSIKQIQNLIETVLMKWGQIDILVNNAGAYIAHDVLSTTEEEWDTVMNIDVKGVFLMSQAVIPHMLKQDKGRIINIASIAGLYGFEDSAAYCSAKGAVISLTRQMALDYTPKGITVNAIAPGVIATDMTKSFRSNTKAYQTFLKKIPADRIGLPKDIAYGAVYLASDESDYIAG